jgi:hypothetical protein
MESSKYFAFMNEPLMSTPMNMTSRPVGGAAGFVSGGSHGMRADDGAGETSTTAIRSKASEARV